MTDTDLDPARAGTASTPGRSTLSRRAGFAVAGAVLALFFLAAAAPSPLYSVYQAQWGFSSTTLTAVFAVYALALLAALLLTGSLSDVLGRRPVLLAAVVVQVVGMALFLVADGVGWLYAARAVQGLATGIATGALSATLVDLEPPGRTGAAAVITTGGPTSGQALGAVVAGALVQFGPAPTRLVFALLLAGFVACAVALWWLPEPVERGRFRWAALRPRVGVPAVARSAFVAAAPCVVAVWALSGLHLSLGPSLATAVLGRRDVLLSALVVTLLTGCGAGAALAVRSRAPRSVLLAACLLLVAGMLVTLAGVTTSSPALLYVGTAVAGTGFGCGLLGTVSVVMAEAPPDGRSRVASSMFVLAYVSFGAPALAAGVATGVVGLPTTVTVYGAAVGVLALVALAATLVLRPHDRSSAR